MQLGADNLKCTLSDDSISCTSRILYLPKLHTISIFEENNTGMEKLNKYEQARLKSQAKSRKPPSHDAYAWFRHL
jgi:hypothetical protein